MSSDDVSSQRRLPLALVRDVAVAGLALALLAGVLWAVLAPEVVATVDAGGAVIESSQATALFAREGVLAVILSGAGAVLAAVVFLRHRRRGVAATVALAVAGLPAALLAAYVGAAIGPDRPQLGPAVGTRFPVPLEVDTPGVLLLWPIASMAVVLVLHAWLGER